MKDMKKAVAEFRTSYGIMVANVTVGPFRLSHLPLWPKAKSLNFMVNYLFLFAQTMELAIAYDESGFIM